MFQLDSERTVASLTRTPPAIIDGAIAADAEVVLLPPIKTEWPTEGVIGIDEDGEGHSRPISSNHEYFPDSKA